MSIAVASLRRAGRWARVAALAALLLSVAVLAAAPGSASAASPWWGVYDEVVPTNLAPGEEGRVIVAVSNLGDAPVEGAKEPVVITDALPAGLSATAISGATLNGTEMKCSAEQPPPKPLQCSFAGTLYPYERLSMTIKVKVDEPPGTSTTLHDGVEVEGGGAQSVHRSVPVTVSEQPTPFGIEEYELGTFNEDGTPATAAGSHPFQMTTTLVLNQGVNRQPIQLPKDLSFNLPAGLVGNPAAVPKCSEADFVALVDETNLCPSDTVVGVATVEANEPRLHPSAWSVPVFNLVPATGEPARFGFEVVGKLPIVIDTSVRSGRDYGVVATVRNATQVAGLLASQVTLWGVPGDPAHDGVRGWECVAGGRYRIEIHNRPCPEHPGLARTPFLRVPTSCESNPSLEPVTSTMEGDSWAEPGSFVGASYSWLTGSGQPIGFTSCSSLPFSPELGAAPEQHSAATPSGLTVSVKVPQSSWSEPEGLAQADVRDSTVSLPAGMELSPSAANGLQACSESQIGFTGFNASSGMAEFNTAHPACPEGSKLGVVHIRTPVLEQELEGAVYLAAQEANPFGSLVALYIVAEDPVSGVLVKLAGEGQLNEATGRVTTRFANTPQVPFDELKLELFGGQRASVSTPQSCGDYSLEGSFLAWSGAEANGVLSPAEDLAVTSGAGGGPCPSGLPFAPGFDAQGASTQAGAFTSFTVQIERPDADQALAGVAVHLPPGIAALLSSVVPCPEPPAGVEWSCGPQSLVGHSTAWAGLGSEPVELPGEVYLTTGYDGAPFGLLVRTHAAAGPFDLGYVNVRSRINVNPTDASVTITTDPGPHGDTLPVRVKGIPAQIKDLSVSVDRPDFEFNPTSCDPKTIEAVLSGSQGATAGRSSPFQVGGCGALPFGPVLTASTAGQGSRADGTSFNVRITSPGLGQANIAKVDLRLPKQLPTRQSTIKLACPEATFDANPASCDEGSVIGRATVRTPVLSTPLMGPAYLVSHGGAEFPDVEFVLQAEGVTLVLDGSTYIDKEGFTYSKFESAPDAPFTSFETELPAGPHSALGVYVPEAENYSVCKTTLLMPTTIISQTGKLIQQETQITPTGCGGVLASHTKKLSHAQELAKALSACRKRYKHSRKKRRSCEAQARRRYSGKATSKGHHATEKHRTAARRSERY